MQKSGFIFNIIIFTCYTKVRMIQSITKSTLEIYIENYKTYVYNKISKLP